MASRIKGITIDIGGDTSSLQASLKKVDSQLKTTQNTLKDVNKLLKLDPSNVELLRQKQKALQDAIKSTNDRLEELRKVSKDSVSPEEWDSIQREIIATEQKLKSLKNQLKDFGSVGAQQIAAAGQKMQEFGGKVEEAGKKLQPLSTAASGLVASLVGLGYKAVTSADDLNTLSKQTGISTDELQKMQYASDLVDVSLTDITGAMKKMKGNMNSHADAWEKIGVSTKNADGSMRDVNSVFKDTLKGLSKITNETERDQVAMELFGKSADSLAGIIDDGGAALEQYGKEAEDLGLILSGDTLDALNETNDTIDKTKAKLGAAFGQLGATAAKSLSPMVDKLAKLIEKVSGKLKNLTPQQTSTIIMIGAIVAAIGPLLTVTGKVITTVGNIMVAVPKLVGVLNTLNPTVLVIIGVIAALVAAGVALYRHWDDVKAFAISLKDSLVATWDNIKTSVSNTMQALEDNIVNLWTNLKTSVSTTAQTLKDSIVNIWNNAAVTVTSVVETLKSGLSTAWESIRSTVTSKATGIKDTVVAVWTNLKTSVVTTADGLKSGVLSAWDGLKSGVSSKVASVKSYIDGLKTKFTDVKTHITQIVQKIKDAFNFNWSFPTIKLPHFKVFGGVSPYGLGGKGKLPSISIEWYKKAYDNPVMFTSPTIMQTPYGMKGFGDGHGAEIVMGLNKLREIVGMTENGVTINVYPVEGMDVNQLAEMIQDRFVALQQQRSLAYA